MKEKVIDSNVILRFLAGDEPQQLEKSTRLIEKVENREETVFLPLHCAFEVVFTLEKYYGVPREEIEEKLSVLFSLKGLHLSLKSIFLEALKTYRQKKVSFADAFTVAQMRWLEVPEIYSFDKDFDEFEGIKRIEP